MLFLKFYTTNINDLLNCWYFGKKSSLYSGVSDQPCNSGIKQSVVLLTMAEH